MRDEWTLGFLCVPSEHAMPIYSERGGVCACVSGWWNTAILMLVFLCSCVCFISGWIAAFYHAHENNYNEHLLFEYDLIFWFRIPDDIITLIIRVCVCVRVCLIVQLTFLTRLTSVSKLWRLTFQVCSCMKVCLCFFVLNIRRLLNSVLSLPLSLSESFSPYFPPVAQSPPGTALIFTRAQLRRLQPCVCAKPLPDPSFPSSRLVHSGCRCSAICSVSVQGQRATRRDPH